MGAKPFAYRVKDHKTHKDYERERAAVQTQPKQVRERRSEDMQDSKGRDLVEITCSACGGKGFVPFTPTPGREIFCQKCHRERKFGKKVE